MDVSIIIVNYNTHDFLEDCLNSIIKFTKNIDYEIIVVDNNSTEIGIEKLLTKFDKVKFILNKENRGFGAGCNTGMRNAEGKYCAIVNPDIIFTENCLLKFFEYMENNEETGVCGGRLINTDENTIYTYNYFPGLFWETLQAAGMGSDYVIEKLNIRLLKSKEDFFEVDWLIGAFMFIRKDIIDKLNGFDEKFFLYYEDVDIQKRIKDQGFKIICIKSIKIKHHEQSSIKSVNGENIYYYHMHKSKIIYMKKHFNFILRNTVRVMNIAGVTLRMLFLPVRNKFYGKKEQKLSQYKKMLSVYFNNDKVSLSS